MQTFTGIVRSAKTSQTLGIEVAYSYRNTKYKKTLSRKTNLLVHNTIEGIKVGDQVEIEKCRQYSKLKHFRVVKKI
jgi:ribosomal protein S17